MLLLAFAGHQLNFSGSDETAERVSPVHRRARGISRAETGREERGRHSELCLVSTSFTCPSPCCSTWPLLPAAFSRSLNQSFTQTQRFSLQCSGNPKYRGRQRKKKGAVSLWEIEARSQTFSPNADLCGCRQKQNRLQDLTEYPAKAGEIQAISCCLVCVPSRLIN